MEFYGNIFNLKKTMLLHGNFVELSVVLLFTKMLSFFNILSSKCILVSGHPATGHLRICKGRLATEKDMVIGSVQHMLLRWVNILLWVVMEVCLQ